MQKAKELAVLDQQVNNKNKNKTKRNTYSIMCSFFVEDKMIYVFNKNKILSYVLASCFVLALFAFRDSRFISNDVELVKVSANVVDNNLYGENSMLSNEKNNLNN